MTYSMILDAAPAATVLARSAFVADLEFDGGYGTPVVARH
jgi:hypothetical protein